MRKSLCSESEPAPGAFSWAENPSEVPTSANYVFPSVRHEKNLRPTIGGKIMLRWAAIFFVIAIIAALLGFTGIAGAAADIAKFLFFLFLAIFVIVLLIGLFVGRKIM